MTGTAVRDSIVDAISPAMSDNARPWNMGSKSITDAPMTTAAAVKSMGLKRFAPASITASSKGIPSAVRSWIKSTRIIEFLTTMPAPAIKPIIDVAVKNVFVSQCAGRIPTSVSGIGSIIIHGVLNDWNQPTTRT